jgi:hypothetical protein
MRISHDRSKHLVPQQLRDSPQICATHHKAIGKRLTKVMPSEPLDAGVAERAFEPSTWAADAATHKTRGRRLLAELRKSVKHLSIKRDLAGLSPLERDSYSSPLEINFRPTSPALHPARTGVTIARRTMKRLLSREQGGRLD